MLKILIKKDMMLLIRDFKFQVFFILLMILFILSGIASAKNVNSLRKEAGTFVSSVNDSAKENSKRMMKLINNFYVMSYQMSDESNLILETKGFPTSIVTGILHSNIQANTKVTEKYSFNLNWLFIISIIGSLMVLIFSFDALSDEKLKGMLKLQTVSGLSRASIVFSKFVSIVLLYFLAVIPAGIVSMILFIALTGLFTPLFIIKIILFLLISLPFISFFTLLGIWISMSRQYMSNIVIALSFWLIFIIIIPQLASIIGKKIYPLPSNTEMINKVWDASDKVGNYYSEKYSFDYNGNGTLEKGIRSKGFDAGDAARAKQSTENRKMYIRQIEVIQQLSFLSPYSIFKYIAEILFDKNLYRMQRQIDQLEERRYSVKQEIVEEDKKDPKSMHLCYAYAEGDKYAVMDRGVTPFSDNPYPHPEKLLITDYQEEGLWLKLQKVAAFILSMIIIDLMMIMMINIQFKKYDIR